MVTCSSQVKSKKDIWYCRLKRLSRMKNSSCLDLAPVCLDYTFKAYLNSDNYLGTPNLREYHNVQKFIRSLIFSIFTNFVIYVGFFTQTWIRFAQEMNILTCISEKFRDIFGDFHPPCKKKVLMTVLRFHCSSHSGLMIAFTLGHQGSIERSQLSIRG